ncbi:MAG TPA: sigma-70 family RNA polymerase sigma factor [Clostridia bacterium]|nr:sigma-70 family RNA polymerase sigma factor [Clostridia bacterium]
MSLLCDPGSPKLSWDDLQKAGDSDLLAQLTAGNDDALAVIVDRYRRLVFSIALRIVKNECEADDVTQSIFVEIYRKAAQFDSARGTLKTWLLQFTYSRSINQRRYLEQRHFYTNEGLAEVDPFHLAGSSLRIQGLSSDEAGHVVRRALSSLNEQQQEAIELIYFQGLTIEEAAAKAGETLAAVRHHYYRGLVKMREFIGTQGAEDSVKSSEKAELRVEVASLEPRRI